MLPKRAGDEVSGELLARGYWRVLGQKLTETEMSELTEMVLEQCEWFPTVAKCNQIMAVDSYSNPFYRTARKRLLDHHQFPSLSPPNKTIADESQSP